MTIRENLLDLFTHKSTILDSFISSISMLAITQIFEGVFKIVGYVLTAVLLIRALVGLRKDYIETKTKKIESKIKQHELKKLEDEQSEQNKRVLRKIVS